VESARATFADTFVAFGRGGLFVRVIHWLRRDADAAPGAGPALLSPPDPGDTPPGRR
jgi:hypothetical protein